MVKYFFFVILLLPFSGAAQNNENKLDAASKELVNPIGSYWSINNYIELTRKSGTASRENKRYSSWLIQAVTPIPIKKWGLTWMNRPQLPIILHNSIPRKTSNGEVDFKNRGGIGDLTLMTALGSMKKTNWGMYMWGIGGAFSFPTASNAEIGSGKFSAGPSGMLVGYTRVTTAGIVFMQTWSYAGSSHRNNVSMGMLQLIYFFQLSNGWQLGDNPGWDFNWKGMEKNKITMPIGFGIYKTVHIGKPLFRFGLTPRYYLVSPDNWGSEWGINFIVTPVVGNPFRNNMVMMK